jgi:hypothetical protein
VLEVSCCGRSNSLNLSSRGEEDAAAILFTLTLPSATTPTGLRNTAQGCDEGATLGFRQNASYPERVVP